MIPDAVQALALADAIGALDPDEHCDLETRLEAATQDVRAEVARLYDAAVEIASTTTGEVPPPHVREFVLAQIAVPSNHTVTTSDVDWVQSPVPGVRMKILAVDRARDRVTMLVRGQPGATYPAHRHTGPEDCYVINGSLVIAGQILRAGDFHHAEAGTDHGELYTSDGVEVLLIAAASDYLPDLTRGA